MPNIEINKHDFEELTGREFTEEELMEDASMMGVHWHGVDDDKCQVEVYPNRPDLLSVEGLARAYRGFFEIETGLREYEAQEGIIKVEKDSSVEKVRPHIGCAVVRNLELDEAGINGLIQLQEKLHESMGRQREKLAIGLHDLSNITPPFTYRAVEPEEVSFQPLEHEDELNLGQILEEHEKGQKYSWILEEHDEYPVIIDSEDQVLSFPPIINNQLTEVHSGTTDIFIDVTGTDEETVKKALNIVATTLAERGGDIESVEVDGENMPDLTPRVMELDPKYLRKVSGLEISDEQVVRNLKKMRLGAEIEDGTVNVEVPAYRDVMMHQYDLIEEVVIAQGYDKIEPEIPEVDQAAEQQPIEQFSDLVRDILLRSGATETNTRVLTSKEKQLDMMKVEEEIPTLKNTVSEERSATRIRLLPSMLKVLNTNKHNAYPQSFFETADVTLLDDTPEGASNRRKAVYVETGDVDFTDAREILQVLERDLGIELSVHKGSRPFLKPARSGEVYLNGESVGYIGEVSGEVLDNWELEKPVSAFELDLEKLRELK
ncbi:MAG: phenylalanine--tRNA ligase subunit beta [Candidatus Nanohalobium sp.]